MVSHRRRLSGYHTVQASTGGVALAVDGQGRHCCKDEGGRQAASRPEPTTGSAQELLKETTVREARLHDAHTAAAVLGVNQRAVVGLMGWSTNAMTMRYSTSPRTGGTQPALHRPGLLQTSSTSSNYITQRRATLLASTTLYCYPFAVLGWAGNGALSLPRVQQPSLRLLDYQASRTNSRSSVRYGR